MDTYSVSLPMYVLRVYRLDGHDWIERSGLLWKVIDKAKKILNYPDFEKKLITQLDTKVGMNELSNWKGRDDLFPK